MVVVPQRWDMNTLLALELKSMEAGLFWKQLTPRQWSLDRPCQSTIFHLSYLSHSHQDIEGYSQVARSDQYAHSN